MKEQEKDFSQQNYQELESLIINLPKGQSINQIEKFWNESAKNQSQIAAPNVMSFSLTLLNMLQIENANNILEVGCGAGNILPYSLQRKKPESKYYAIDLSSQMLALSRYRIEQLIKFPFRSQDIFPDNLEIFGKEIVFDQFNLHLQKANSENLEQFNDNFFDIYFSNFCLQITEDATKMLKESYRVLNQGGRVGFTVWGKQQNCQFQTILPKVLSKNGLQMPAGRSNFYLNKKEDLIKMMEFIGFKNILSWYQFIPFPIVEEQDALKIIEGPYAKKLYNDLSQDQKEKIKSDLITELNIFLKQKKEPIGMEALFIIGMK